MGYRWSVTHTLPACSSLLHASSIPCGASPWQARHTSSWDWRIRRPAERTGSRRTGKKAGWGGRSAAAARRAKRPRRPSPQAARPPKQQAGRPGNHPRATPPKRPLRLPRAGRRPHASRLPLRGPAPLRPPAPDRSGVPRVNRPRAGAFPYASSAALAPAMPGVVPRRGRPSYGYASSAALAPAMRPNVCTSAMASEPRRFVPWMPPVISPAANRFGMVSPLFLTTCASTVMRTPPMV